MLRGHGGTVFDASFSPNGRFVVTGGPATAGVWDTVTRERLYFLQGHEGPVRAAAFSSPTRIVTRGDDGVRTYVCDVCGGLRQLVALAERRLAATSRELSSDERRQVPRRLAGRRDGGEHSPAPPRANVLGGEVAADHE